MNGYSYVENSPIRYRDPRGLISEGDEAVKANLIVAGLYQWYGVRIVKDWGYVSRIIPSSYLEDKIRYECEWQEGNWRSVEELRWVSDAVADVSHVMGGNLKFRSAMENRLVTIERSSEIRLPFFDDPAGMAPPFVGWLTGDILLADSLFTSQADAKYLTAHELGHVWDWRTNWGSLHYEMSIELGTMVCPDTPESATEDVCWFDIRAGKEPPPGRVLNPYAGTYVWEDWAEAFASYVYPEYYHRPGFLQLGTLRRQYVERKIEEIP